MTSWMANSYATAMLMASMLRQAGHSVEMFLRTYSKSLDCDQNDLEMVAAGIFDCPIIVPWGQSRQVNRLILFGNVWGG